MSEFQQKFDQAVWNIVSAIKPGQIMSYGQVARLAGFPRNARMVSRAMSRSKIALPWFRVVRSNHTLAFSEGTMAYKQQKELLEAEGSQVVAGKVIPLVSDIDKELDELMWGPE